jgi:hypothetical protein
MSYREVDFNVVMDACYHWLKQYDQEMNEFLTEFENSKWTWRANPKSITLERKEIESIRVRRLLALSKCPGSLNRIIYLTADDAKLLFGEL